MTENTSPTPEELQVEAETLSEALHDYIATIDAPVLMAELRCLSGSIGATIEDVPGGHGLGMAFRALAMGLARFDDSTGHALPIAVTVAECRCSEEDGLTHRLSALIKAAEAAARARAAAHVLPPGFDLGKLVESIREQLPEGTNIGGVVAVPMQGGKPAGDPIVLAEGDTDEPPAPGLYL